MPLAGRTAVVTGAASGIGRGTAMALARRSCSMALADIDEAGLQATAAQVRAHGVHVTCHRLDVADPGAVAAFPDLVRREHAGVDVLVNNAGVAMIGTFEQIRDHEFEWLLDINLRGVVRMTRAFLPLLRASDDARIVNVSSVFGLVAPPGQTAYATSKFAVRGFSEALRHELRGTHIGVTVVHPGGIATNITHSARVTESVSVEQEAGVRASSARLLRLPPSKAGETIVRGIERRRDRVLIGADAHGLALLVRLVPVRYWRIVERFTAG
jgi:NAD(P)-dependent dehydrogenase (short-subunit alcohol dehydrogenase family)